jgi:hypothetical protein
MQRALPRLQKLTPQAHRQRVPVGPQHDPLPAAPPNPESAIRIAADGAGEDPAVVRAGTPNDLRVETRDLLDLTDRIDRQK